VVSRYALEDFTKIPASKLNSTNLNAVMDTTKKLVPEGIVDVCIQIFNKIKHLETGSSALLYDDYINIFLCNKNSQKFDLAIIKMRTNNRR